MILEIILALMLINSFYVPLSFYMHRRINHQLHLILCRQSTHNPFGLGENS